MHFVTLLQWPSPLEQAAAHLARVADLSPYEARTRLSGDPPRIAAIVASQESAESTAQELSGAGFHVAVLDASAVEHDADRDIVSALAFGDDTLEATLKRGDVRTIRYDALSMLLHGVRTTSSVVTSEEKVKKFDAGRALLTGGLVTSKTSTKSSTRNAEVRESFLYLYEAGIRPAVALYERRTNYSFLGTALQPSAAANFATVVAEMRRRAPHARYDARLTRPFSLGVTPLAPAGMDSGEWKSDIAAALESLTA